MNNVKIRFPIAGIAFLISFLSILYFMIDNLLSFLEYGLNGFYDFLSIVGIFWFSHLLTPLFLAVILFTKTRGIWLPIGIAAQIAVLCDYIFYFYIFNDIPTLINEQVYPIERIIDNSIYSFGIAVLVIYTFIFSLLCRKSDNQKRTRSMLIGWFIAYAVYIICFIIYIVMHTIDFSGFMLFVPYSVSWIFLALWIAFPYKKRANLNNYPYVNQQLSESAYKNPYNNNFNNNQSQPPKQYNPYSGQGSQQFSQQSRYNYPVGQNSFTQQENYNTPKTCSYCGAPLNDGNIFCGNCGTKCSD